MSTISLRIDETLLPLGVRIDATLNTNQNMEMQLEQVKRVIRFAHDEADIARTATPGERTLTARFDKIEKMIINGLPAETKLAIANEANSK